MNDAYKDEIILELGWALNSITVTLKRAVDTEAEDRHKGGRDTEKTI